jgi:hypothetical protein
VKKEEDLRIKIRAGRREKRREVELRIRKYALSKKENKIFLIYKEIQSGAVGKSFMRKGFLKYMRKCENISPYTRMRRPLVKYDFATAPF